MNSQRNTTQDAASEYLPRPGESNGNGNGNGKAFVLTQPKSSEEIARDEIRKTVPRLRRECSRDSRLIEHVGAKWLFGVLTDLSFLNDYGGDGFGRVYISTHDLQRIFGHRRESFSKWRDKLVDTGWIWFQDMWPKSCWGITGVCRQPELFPPHSCFVRQMAKASGNTQPEGGPSVAASLLGDGKTAENGQNSALSQPSQPPEAATLAGGSGQTGRLHAPHWPRLTDHTSRESRPDQRAEAARLAGGAGQYGPPVTASTDDGPGHIKESPLETLAQETRNPLKRSTLFNAQEAGGEGEGTGQSESASLVASLLKGLKVVKEPPKPKSTEGIFLLDVGAMMDLWRKGSAKAEMANSGAWWRLAFRADRDLILRVLAETLRAVKEGQIQSTPGQYAVDLWKRWGGKLP